MEETMNKITISRTNLGKIEEKEIYELEKIDTFKYGCLGQGMGISVAHCVQMGIKNVENFWHRVYGYQIIKNETQEKEFLEAMKTVKPEVKGYITIKFYERLANQRLMFIPKRLNIPEYPKLNNFPLNIMFQTNSLTDDGNQIINSVIYNPDLSTFREKRGVQRMKYYNSLSTDRKFWVEIEYDTKRESWSGTKYCGDEVLGMADAPNWDKFFIHLTMLGVGNDISS